MVAESDPRSPQPGASGGFRLRLLKVQGADVAGAEHRFNPERDRVRLGRADDCDVVVTDSTVSRHHAEVVRTRDGYVLVDQGSANGVWVDDARVTEHRLVDGQQFRLGAAVIQFTLGAPAAAVPVAPRPAAPPPPPAPPPADATVQDAAAREQAMREATARQTAERERAAREAAERESAAREQAGREAAAREAAAKEAAERERAAKEQAAREAAAKEAAERDRAAKEQAAREAAAKEQAAREAAAHETAERDRAAREAAAREAAAQPAAAPAGGGTAAGLVLEVPPGIEVAEESPLAAHLRREATLVEADGNHPFLLDEPEMAWFVESGRVEIFTVAVEDNRPTGGRTHFVSVVPGQLMFGMDLQAFAMGSGFLAVGRMGTHLRKISIAQLQQLANDPVIAKDIANRVDTWVTELSRSLTKEIIPGPLVDVNLVGGGEETELQNQQRARSNKGALWIEVIDGNLLFIGMEELLFWQEKASEQQLHHSIRVDLDELLQFAQRKKIMFPITTETWIEASNARGQTTTLKTYAAETVAGEPSFWKGLGVFHEVLCQCEFMNKRLAVVDEFNRLKTKAEYSKAAERAGYREIALVMEQPKAVETVVKPGEEVDPVLSACRLVGGASGIRVIPHPEASRDDKFDDRVAAIAKASRFRTRVVALREEWWKNDHGPILAKLDKTGGPVALVPKGASAYELVSPVTGERRTVNARVAEELAPFGQAFYRPFPDGTLTAKDLIIFGARGLKTDFLTLILMGVALGVLGSLTPIFTGKLFDTAIPQADRGVLLQYTTALFVAAFVSAAFKITQSIATLRVQGKMDYSIQSALWDRLLNLPSGFFREYTAGDLADRAAGIDAIRSLLAGAGIAAVLGSVSSVFYVVLMFKYSLPLAMLCVGLTLVFVAVSFSANYIQLRYQRHLFTLAGRITGLVLQFVSGVGKLRVAGAENHAFRVWAREYAAQRRLEFSVGRVQNNVQIFNAGFPLLSTMAIFYITMTLTQKAGDLGGPPPLSTGDFLAFNAAYGTFMTAMLALSEASLNLLRAVPIYERLRPIIETEAEIDESKAYPGTLKGEIEMSHIHFRYIADGPWVLDDLSLKIRPGEVIAFVGSSGCGKSTLMRLMLGFETPEKGSVYYDGQDLASLDLREVRQQLGVVLQESKLLPADIFRNIVGTADLPIESAWEAARQAGLADDIAAMPMGMHTYVAEGGGGFSGGQRQRLLIARAVVKKPRVIFLDEATSALDNASQATVTESMERLQATRIAIAHRLSTIINADRICYMDQGKIVEMGSYEELMKLGGKFYELARRQMA